MNVNGVPYRTIWVKEDDEETIQIIDQRPLPHKFVVEDLKTADDFAAAIRDMHVRGAGLIGATAGYGMYVASLKAFNSIDFDYCLLQAAKKLIATRPTAVNLKWAVKRQLDAISKVDTRDEKVGVAFKNAKDIADEDVAACKSIGEHGVGLIEELYRKRGGPVNILTHCNAGWLAFVDYGSATAPIYEAHERGIPVHVWVDETRPRSQGARLTAWELEEHGVPYTVIADNTGGHLMQIGEVDIVIVGTDRTTYTGDVINKIGTYLKALAARDNNVPFYVALPSSTFDWELESGYDVPIEKRGGDEVKYVQGLYEDEIVKVLLTPEESEAANYAFDVTPRNLVNGLITERGICEANKEGILNLYPEYRKS
jgi:methylthioribose-1-phosphate isomerase